MASKADILKVLSDDCKTLLLKSEERQRMALEEFKEETDTYKDSIKGSIHKEIRAVVKKVCTKHKAVMGDDFKPTVMFRGPKLLTSYDSLRQKMVNKLSTSGYDAWKRDKKDNAYLSIDMNHHPFLAREVKRQKKVQDQEMAFRE